MSGKRKGPKGRSKGRGPGPSSKRPKDPRGSRTEDGGGPDRPGKPSASAGARGRGSSGAVAPPNRAARRAALQRERSAAPGPERGGPELTRTGQPALPRDVWRDESRIAPVVGVLRRRGKTFVAEPLFDRGRLITVEKGARELGEGHIGLFAPAGGGRRGVRGHRVVRDLGTPDVARDVLEALLLDHGLPRRVAREVGMEAEGVAGELGPATRWADGPPRRDLRDVPTFTIDPATAKDFDDAISAEAVGDDGARIQVHIADVSAFVRPGGAIDGDARWRGTSVYVPGTVEPMLPPALSNDACSLVPGVDRLAVTVQFDVRDGTVGRAEVSRSIIRSDARLTYEEVDDVFAGTARATDPWATPLDVARRVALALQDRREQTTNALELDTGEPRFTFDDAGHPTGIVVDRATESHRLIEHLMVTANEQVAKLLTESRTPTLHRVHGLPQPSAVEKLAEQLGSLGVAIPASLGTADGGARGIATRKDAAAAVAELSRSVDAHVRRAGHGRAGLSFLVLRALQQARYEPKGLGHAGLGLEHYCHFTSPIRRYPDLVAHRAVLSLVGAGEEAPAGSSGRLEELGVWCSATEREAMQIERSADAITRAFLLERLLFEHGVDRTFQGEVTGLVGGGAFVRFGGEGLPDEAFEGFVPVRRIGDDSWDLNEAGTILGGARSGATLRLGDPLDVAVERVEPVRGRATLLPVR
ncbi:ribonuclease R family protein [Patulibacter minatonensis]|uniref:ribonuclease R family protein n=1 Tax=Patulibacter minatonensis TaxID=298163 RepID=UPI0004B8D2ED|nr:RNB domain-containing ribonuclease [Patulibacter minatonensis]